MKIRNHKIYLTDTELSKTRDILVTELSCGHHVLPKLKRVFFLKTVRCDVCRKNVKVMSDTVYHEPSTMLKG